MASNIAETAQSIIGKAIDKRIFTPSSSVYAKPGATHDLTEQRQAWRDQGDVVVFAAGGYDLLHPNHIASLVLAKCIGASFHFGINQHVSWESLTAQSRQDYLAECLGNNAVKTIVSLKGNLELADRKSNKPEKGGGVRPILDWSTRAFNLLCASVPLSTERTLRLADAITIDDKFDPNLANTPHHNLIDLADALVPDIWPIYHESKNLLKYLGDGSERLPQTVIVKVDDQDFYTDLLTGSLSTSAIAGRMAAGSQHDSHAQ